MNMLVGSVTTPITSTTPSWLADNITKKQADQDTHYADQVRMYNEAAAGWIEAAKQSQAIGAPIPQFAMGKPQKIVFYDNGFYTMAQATVDDPSVVAPVVPPPPPPAGPAQPGFGGQGTTAPQTTDAILSMLSQILDGVSALRAKQGV